MVLQQRMYTFRVCEAFAAIIITIQLGNACRVEEIQGRVTTDTSEITTASREECCQNCVGTCTTWSYHNLEKRCIISTSDAVDRVVVYDEDFVWGYPDDGEDCGDYMYYGEYELTMPLLTVPSIPSASDCAGECYNHPGCTYFTFKSDTGVCVLSDKFDTDGIQKENVGYYGKI